MKRQEGVTLIALAVTIIVMLILAGVSISTLTGNSGISKNAENARLQNELGSIIEKINLAISESFMNDVNVDKMKVLIDKGYIIENKDKNYDYVDASTILSLAFTLHVVIKFLFTSNAVSASVTSSPLLFI